MCAAACRGAVSTLLFSCQSAACGARCCVWRPGTAPRPMPWVQQRSWATYTGDRSPAIAAVHSMRSVALSHPEAALRGRSVLCLLACAPACAAQSPIAARHSACRQPQASAGHGCHPAAQTWPCRSGGSRSVATSAAPTGGRRGLGMGAPSFVYEGRDDAEARDEPVRLLHIALCYLVLTPGIFSR